VFEACPALTPAAAGLREPFGDVPPGPILVSGLNIVINVRRFYNPYVITAIVPIVSCCLCTFIRCCNSYMITATFAIVSGNALSMPYAPAAPHHNDRHIPPRGPHILMTATLLPSPQTTT
jgi:hypothetical protein